MSVASASSYLLFLKMRKYVSSMLESVHKVEKTKISVKYVRVENIVKISIGTLQIALSCLLLTLFRVGQYYYVNGRGPGGRGEKRPPLGSSRKCCQMIWLAYMSMPLKFCVIIFIFEGSRFKIVTKPTYFVRKIGKTFFCSRIHNFEISSK